MKLGPQPPPPLTYRIMHLALGPLQMALRLSCKDAFELSAAQMDRELTGGEAFRLKFHLMVCSVCRHLPRQFRLIRELIRACEHEQAHEDVSNAQLPPEAKERIIEQLKKM